MIHGIGTLVCGVLALAIPLWLSAEPQAHAATATECTLADLQAIAPADTTITAVTLVSATATLPEYCQVNGYVTTPEPVNTVNFRIGLPTTWNGKFYFEGVGGFGGTIGSLTAGLARNYASASTDTGHQGSSFDASWAFNNRAKEIDYGYRGTHVTAVAAKSLTHAYYGSPPQHAYLSGCSNGGRQGLMEAQRYPADFDGIIAGAPGISSATATRIWNYQTLLADWDHYMPASKLPLLANAVLANCDAKDGLVDGIIDDPRRCTFDPAHLQCPAGVAPTV